MVFTLALKMLKSREEAEEVSQDTFIKAYKNLSKFKGESKFSTWLYKIGYRACLDSLKKNKENEVFQNSLGVSGVSGTMKYLSSEKLKGKIKAKSGSADGILNSRDKLRSFQILSKHKIGIPPTVFVKDKKDVLPEGMEGITDAEWTPDEID